MYNIYRKGDSFCLSIDLCTYVSIHLYLLLSSVSLETPDSYRCPVNTFQYLSISPLLTIVCSRWLPGWTLFLPEAFAPAPTSAWTSPGSLRPIDLSLKVTSSERPSGAPLGAPCHCLSGSHLVYSWQESQSITNTCLSQEEAHSRRTETLLCFLLGLCILPGEFNKYLNGKQVNE